VSTSGISVNSPAGSPISISGAASGLDTTAIISALLSAERQPITRLTNEQATIEAQQKQLQGIQASLNGLSFAASEFALPSLFESSQSVTSSAPALVAATATGGAGVGGYEVEVTRLASSAQRTFTFTSPGAEQQLTVSGQQYTLKAGETVKELASAINAQRGGTVYAAVLEGSKIVLSSRVTGAAGAEAIQVSSPEGALVEVPGTAREGHDAEFSVDGVAGTSTSNTVTDAIAGVTLSLAGLTNGGPVTVNVAAPGLSVSAVESQVQSFIKLYNTTVESIQKQLAERPPGHGAGSSQIGAGTLYQDQELSGLLANMRQIMYEPIEGLPAEVASPASIGISTGAPSGSVTSQSALAGQLKLEPAKLASAVQANPAAVQEMLQQWSLKLQKAIGATAEPGGGIATRTQDDQAQIGDLGRRISSLNELLAHRERALQATYAELESIISQNTAQASWLTSQEKSLAAGG